MMMNAIRVLWLRLLGMKPKSVEHWTAWAVEQAIAGGARGSCEIRETTIMILNMVHGEPKFSDNVADRLRDIDLSGMGL